MAAFPQAFKSQQPQLFQPNGQEQEARERQFWWKMRHCLFPLGAEQNVMHLYVCKWAGARILHQQIILGGIQWAAGLELIHYARTNNYSGEIALFGAMEMKKSWQNTRILNCIILNRHLMCLDCWTWFRKLKRTPQVGFISLEVNSLICAFFFPWTGYCWVWSTLNYFTIVNNKL